MSAASVLSGGVRPAEGLMADGLVSVPEACGFLSVSRATVYQLMADGRLAYCKVGHCRRIPRRALVELAEASLVGAEG
jgi:excisionase family DNA binding protein